ncbi:DNA-directed RNA polymerase I subunit RPA43 [Heracleum sosnowskyi]|uniref:DNA-directed RNA polymerase subunit n=1 Tax=Heracleum sosnowskyi TaxID=360622 RepID=A0AAD8MJ97_9APIA|nr:DNA-directed RNA polymerase I subunit RPA43 [Heracleum sosnowskyi]
MEGLKVADGNLVIYVPPSKSKNVSDAILSELSSQLFKFSESLDGVLLAYDVDMVGNLAKILPGIHPFFGVKLKSKLLLFNPKPNMLLEGKVVKLSQHAIHVIVLGFSSAVITEEDIPKEFRYKIKSGKGYYANRLQKQHKIKVGTIIRFAVKSFDEEILHISGSLLPANTGSALWLHTNSEDRSQADRNSKKLRVEDDRLESMQHNNGAVNGEIVSLNSDRQTK